MAEDKYKVDKTKPPKPIQLKDASGPPIHDLADDRNYEFLDMLFKRKEDDSLAKEGLDPNYVYQLLFSYACFLHSLDCFFSLLSHNHFA